MSPGPPLVPSARPQISGPLLFLQAPPLRAQRVFPRFRPPWGQRLKSSRGQWSSSVSKMNSLLSAAVCKVSSEISRHAAFRVKLICRFRRTRPTDAAWQRAPILAWLRGCLPVPPERVGEVSLDVSPTQPLPVA